MGAEFFKTLVKGQDSPDEAFKYAVAQAEYDHGHSGYTGTIAEKDTYKVIKTVSSEEEAYRLANEILDQDTSDVCDKWGPAGFIRIVSETNPDSKPMFLFFGWAST